jgi:hypothetical protein
MYAALIEIFAPLAVCAQFLDYGADPARLRWNKATLPHYKLIYPQGLDSLAYRYALYLENAYPHIMKTIGEPLKTSFPVVMHPADMLSNGLVSWSPRRMELLTTPSFTQQAESWDKHLVVHESRHVVQTGKLMRGLYRYLYYAIGEQAAGAASFFVPKWFFEGDAVGVETAMTNAGRGRLPEFQMIYRAQMLSGKFFSFDKWYMGSYKDNTGTLYTLGYNLTSFARRKYGADIWEKTTGRYARQPISFPSFSNAFKHYTGSDFNQLFAETFDFMRDEWASRDTGYIIPRYLSPSTRQYTSYRYPQAWNDSTVIAYKTSNGDLPSIVALTNGRETHLTYTGTLHSRITLHHDRIYWAEIIPSPCWTHENHTVIKYYDLAGKRLGTLTRRGRYFSPSASGSTLAVSTITEKGENSIVVISTQSGQEQAQYATPSNAFVKELTWGGKDTIFAVAVADAGISLLRLDAATGRWEELLPPTSANISSPSYDGRLYFESGLDGINNIYCLDDSLKAMRLTASRFGAFNPSISAEGRNLLYADYQAQGYRIASLPADSLANVAADFAAPDTFTLAETLARQENFILNDSALKPVDFRPRPYRKAANLLQLHSWAPVYYDVSALVNGGSPNFATAIKPGATIISQNPLNTAITQAGWYYSAGYHHGKLDFIYMGWPAVVHINADYGGKAFNAVWEKDEDGETTLRARYADRNLLETQVQIYLPLDFSAGHHAKDIQPSLTWFMTNDRYQQYRNRKMNNFQYILGELLLRHYRKMAVSDILPKWGYQLRLQYLSMPFNAVNFTALYAARLTTYWPGVMPNHSLMLKAAYQYQPDVGNPLYIPRQLLESARGYEYQAQTHQQTSLKADYAFPVASPDVSLGPLLYLRRLRANLFFDATFNQTNSRSKWTTQSSFGGDILFDCNALRFYSPLSTGIRLIKPAGRRLQAEALFSIRF